MNEKTASNLKPSRWNGRQCLVVIVALVLLVAGLVFLWQFGGNDPDQATDQDSTTPEVVTVYNPCADDDLEEKPFTCFTSVNYSFDFLQRFRSRPDKCWIAVNGFVYDITTGPEGYEYPGPNPIDNLCGQDATERFQLDSVAPPGQEYLKGSARP